MSLDPRTQHLLEQFTGTISEVSNVLATYKRELLEGGMTRDEAWVLVRRMELRLLGPVLTSTEEELKAIESEGSETSDL